MSKHSRKRVGILKMIDVLLKNISQVVLISNKWTGLFILIGLFVADWTIGLALL